MFFALHAPAVFKQKSAFDPSVLNRNSIASMLTITKNVAHGPLVFGTEKRHGPSCFLPKFIACHAFSLQSRRVERQFHIKREVCEATNSSEIRKVHDFLDPLGVELLSL